MAWGISRWGALASLLFSCKDNYFWKFWAPWGVILMIQSFRFILGARLFLQAHPIWSVTWISAIPCQAGNGGLLLHPSLTILQIIVFPNSNCFNYYTHGILLHDRSYTQLPGCVTPCLHSCGMYFAFFSFPELRQGELQKEVEEVKASWAAKPAIVHYSYIKVRQYHWKLRSTVPFVSIVLWVVWCLVTFSVVKHSNCFISNKNIKWILRVGNIKSN